MQEPAATPGACHACREGLSQPFAFTMAFQPIVDLEHRSVFAHEALIRGPDGTGATDMLRKVTPENRYRFDQSCRIKAVELAARLAVPGYVSINFLPNAVYQPATCIRATLAAARRHDFPTDRLIFEVTEQEEMVEKSHLREIMLEYKRQGFKTAIDDFGAGHSGLNLLAEFQPDIIKLDRALLQDIDAKPVSVAIVRGILGVCEALGIEVIAEGVETMAELGRLRELGVRLFQGFLFARPGFETLPDIHWPTFPSQSGDGREA